MPQVTVDLPEPPPKMRWAELPWPMEITTMSGGRQVFDRRWQLIPVPPPPSEMVSVRRKDVALVMNDMGFGNPSNQLEAAWERLRAALAGKPERCGMPMTLLPSTNRPEFDDVPHPCSLPAGHEGAHA